MRGFLRFFIITAFILNSFFLTSCSNNVDYQVLDEERYLNPVFDKADTEKDIPYKKLTDSNAVGQNTLDLYEPHGDKDKSRKVVILVHGGGFTGGDKNEMSELAYKLAQRGYVALSVNYTLGWSDSNYSETAITTTTSDIVAAVNWLKSNSEKYRVDMNQVAIGGSSAGGYISVDTALNKSLYRTGPKFFAVIDMFGGMRAQRPSEESPPVLMIHGDKDDTVPISESYNLKSALDNAGVYNELFVMKGAGHGIANKYYDEVLFRITEFLYKTAQRKLNPLFETEQNEATVTLGESAVIQLKAKRKVNIKKMKICIPKDCKVDSFKQMANGDVSFSIDIPESCDISGNHILSVEPVAEKLSYGKTLILLKAAEPVEITAGSRIKGSNEDTIQKFFIIKNKSKTRDISGSINVKGSKNKTQNFSFKSLKPGEEKEFLLSDDTFGYCSFNVELKSGLKRTYTEGVFAAKAYKTNQPPQIDGSLNDWKQEPSFILDDKSQVKLMTDWGGLKDLSCTVRVMWDNKYLYLAALVKDNIHSERYTAVDIWNGDSLQFSFDTQRGLGTDEFGLALDDSGQLYKWRWIASRGHSEGAVDSIRAIVKKNGDNMTYEAAVPWNEILQNGAKPNPNSLLGFSFLVNDSDGESRKGWIEFSGGIGEGRKDSSMFGELYLMN